MSNEIVIAIVSAAISSVITLVTTLYVERRKEKRENRIEHKKEQKEAFQTRPELAIVDYKDYLGRIRYGIKQSCDLEVFVASIERVETTGRTGRDDVYACYREEDFDQDNWCCVIYTFENVGKTNISALSLICNYKRDTCIFPCENAKRWSTDRLLNYWCFCDKKIRVGEKVTVKFCYHKDHVITGAFSAIMSIVMEDDNKRYWTQPLFAPNEKIYDSRSISYKDYRDEISTDIAETCFKRPELW